jgi:hypothetical protein
LRRRSFPCVTLGSRRRSSGVSKPERVEQTLDWAGFPIPEAVWEELKAAPFSTHDPEATRERRPGRLQSRAALTTRSNR